MDRQSETRQRSNICTYESLFCHLPSINQLLGQFGQLVHQPILCKPIEDALVIVKQGLATQLASCLDVLGRRDKRHQPLGEITNTQPRKKPKTGPKPGRKVGRNKEEHERLVLMTALGFYRDEHCRSIRSYLGDHQLDSLRSLLMRLIQSEERLKLIADGKQRADANLRKEAIGIVRRRLGGADDDDDDEEEDRSRTIFEYSQLKTIANSLSFGGSPRRTRDGEVG